MLIEEAVGQIIQDIDVGDLTAIYELLERVPLDALASFLPEERLHEING